MRTVISAQEIENHFYEATQGMLLPGFKRNETENSFFFSTEDKISSLNFIGLKNKTDLAWQEAQAHMRYFLEKSLPFTVFYRDKEPDNALEQKLSEAGLLFSHHCHCAAVSPENIIFKPWDEVSCQKLTEATDISEAAKIASTVFSVPFELVNDMFQLASSSAAGEIWTLASEGQMVSVLMTWEVSDQLGIYWGATLPTFQKRGYIRHLVSHIVAQKPNIRHLVSQTAGSLQNLLQAYEADSGESLYFYAIT